MQSKKKAIGNMVFLFVVFGLTIYGVFIGCPPVAEGVIQLKKNPTEENKKHILFLR